MRLFVLLVSMLCLFFSVNSMANVDRSSTMHDDKRSVISKHEINLNTANAKLLATIKGVGMRRAQLIVAYRKEHGDFKSIDDLREIKGIGYKLIEKIRHTVMVKK